jgi:hypothetical protein
LLYVTRKLCLCAFSCAASFAHSYMEIDNVSENFTENQVWPTIPLLGIHTCAMYIHVINMLTRGSYFKVSYTHVLKFPFIAVCKALSIGATIYAAPVFLSNYSV